MGVERGEAIKQAALAEMAWNIGKLFKPEIKGYSNLKLARQHLDEGRSLLILINHINIIDTFVMMELKKQLDGYYSTLIVAAAIKLGEGREKFFGLDLVEPTFKGLSVRKNFLIASLVQTIDLEGREMHPDYKMLNQRSLTNIAAVLNQSKGVALYAPEGHRTGGSLIKAERGIDLLFKHHPSIQPKTQILLVAQEGNEDLLKKNVIHVGKPFTYQEAVSEIRSLRKEIALSNEAPLGDLSLIKIGSFLPKRYWGEYAESVKRYKELK